MKFTGAPLDRAGNYRDNLEWQRETQNDGAARFVAVWNQLVLFEDDGEELIALPFRADHPSVKNYRTDEMTFLGVQGEIPYFVLDLSTLNEPEISAISDSILHKFIDLRSAMPRLRHEDAALTAYAKGMVHWHQHNLFCGICGSETTFKNAGHMRQCANTACSHQLFPRTDPVVIMLVERKDNSGDRYCLLGRQSQSPTGRYSTLAGFVDPGESLEEAVAREVYEETGVRVDNIRYESSQPWPFPASLMIGFQATATNEKIVIDEKEIADARWFSIEEIKAAGNWGEKSSKPLLLPRAGSISRYLIDQWAKECGGPKRLFNS